MFPALICGIALIWYGLGVLGSYLGWKYFRQTYECYATESFWQPFYLNMALLGPFNLISVLVLGFWS